jgi:pyruvate/2-oxoglutarate dehydrogenase complex dihydrolipoamide acyltransferase (E2) component
MRIEMPIYCDIGYDSRMLNAVLTEPGLLARWSVRERAMLSPNDEIAVLKIDGTEARVHVRFPCFVERLVAKPGELLHLGSVLLRVLADGEEIPEGFRYCSLT